MAPARNLLPLLLLVSGAPASAQKMNADEFYRRAVALTGKGVMAVFSRSEMNALADEARAAGLKAREARLADVAAGRRPRYCPPSGGQSMSSSEFMGGLAAIPAEERARIDMAEASVRVLARRFPCR